MSSFFSPRCGTPTVDLVAGAGTERGGQQRALLDLVRQQHQARAGLVVVELRQEGAQHLGGVERGVRLREVGAVAPVLAGAEEEHLDAALAALLVDGEDVGLLDGPRVDALVALHMAERGQPVAIDGGALEIERLRPPPPLPSEISAFTFDERPERKARASATSST